MSDPIVITVLPDHLLQFVWLAHCSKRSLGDQFEAMIAAHEAGLELAMGEPYHTHHCRAVVALYGWPELGDGPAKDGRIRGLSRVRIRGLSESALAALDKGAARAHRDRDGQASAVVESYMRSLGAASPSPDRGGQTDSSGAWSARPRGL